MRSFAQPTLRMALGLMLVLAVLVVPGTTAHAATTKPAACVQAAALTQQVRESKAWVAKLKTQIAAAREANKPKTRIATLNGKLTKAKARLATLKVKAAAAREACAEAQSPTPQPENPPVSHPTTLGAFYRTPETLPAANGDVIRSEKINFVLDPIVGIRPPADAWRVMYRSTDRKNTPIAVTGTVLVPRKSWVGKGERPLIGYAVGTQGLGDRCAPSYAMTTGTEYESLFIAGLLRRGYAVAVTDYQGLGTDGLHTYMSREVQGRAVLDAVRAAQRLTAAGIADDGPVAITGYSQGGGAAGAAAEVAPTYASSMKIKAVSVGAAPANLTEVGKNLDGSLYFGFLGYAIAGIGESYNLPVEVLLNDKGKAAIARLKSECTVESILNWKYTKSSSLTVSGKSLPEILAEPLFAGVADEQTIGKIKPVNVPILITHSLTDDVIPYKVGKQMASGWCGKGANVELRTMMTPTHVGGAIASFPRVFSYLEGRFGLLPDVHLNSCWRL